MANGADAASLQGDFNLRLALLETRIDTILPTLATKADLGEAMGGMKASLGEMKGSISDLRGDMKASIADTKSAIITWLTASLLGVVAIVLSALFFVAGRIAPVGVTAASVPVAATPARAPAQLPAIDPLR